MSRYDGAYGIAYCGDVAVGAGLFRIAGGKLDGLDNAGIIYSGSAIDEPGGLRLVVDMKVPPGVRMVQGVEPQPIWTSRHFEVQYPATSFGDGEPTKVPVPPSIVTTMVRRIPDEYAAELDQLIRRSQPR